MDVRETAMHLLAEMEEQFPAEEYQAAWQRSRAAELATVIRTILE